MMALKVGKLKISKRLPIEEQYPMLDKELKNSIRIAYWGTSWVLRVM